MFRASPKRLMAALILTVCTLQTGIARSGEFAGTTTSPSFGNNFTEAQKALSEKQWAVVINNANQVLERTNRTPGDTYAANHFLLEAHKASGDQARMRSSLQGMIDANVLPPKRQAELVRALQALDSSSQ